ncbi:MAG: PAS domain S-box protein [Deltaproteobacteria bacterium]|nr:MAG: PAS domain S-box protein [Deltaproteobacteria bacterium]
MNDQAKTNEELLEEISVLQQRIQELEQSESECKRSEEALRESEEKNRALFEDGPIESMVVDREGRIIQYNKAFERSSKKGSRRLPETGSRMYVDYASNHSTDMRTELMNSIHSKTAKTFNEMPYKGRFLNIHIAPTKEGAIISAINVTERKQVEEALRESENKFRLAMDATNDALWDWNIVTNEVYRNPRHAAMLGYEQQEFPPLQEVWEKLIHPDDQQRVFDCLEAHLKGKTQFIAIEYRVKTKSGDYLWVLGRGKVVAHDDDGKPIRIIGTNVDITERKKAEEALRENEQHYRDLFDQANEGLLLMTLDGKLSEVNHAFAEMHGYTVDELKDMDIRKLDVLKVRTLEDLADIMRRIQAGEVVRFEVEHYHKDGHIFPLSVTASIIHIRGQMYSLAFHQDITERKQAEEENRSLQERLQNAEKMEMMGKLAGRVAHDLNNVLGVLSGYSELLTERIPVGNPLREYAANILKSSIKAAAIVEDLLTLTRRGVRVMEVAKFNKIIANLLATPEFDKLVAYHPNVIVKTDLAKDLLNISGSPVHIEKTVRNLLSNAVEAIAGGGEVIIKTENRYLDKAIEGYQTVMEGEYVVLTVSDTGKGIPASELKNIFEPFYTKKSMGRSGTGMGLAIVWGTVQDHNGYIDVQSTEEKGTTITLYFPATREKAEVETQKTPMEQYMGHGESVLVVDDVQEQREVATTLLTQLGYSVNAVSSGEAAVEYLKSNKADILVLDMIMEPGIDGLDTYKLVLEINPLQKAIIVSGFSETDRTREAQKLGAGPYVKKPYLTEKIGVAIKDELARK